MLFKTTFICLLLVGFSHAAFQEVRIGKIDPYYRYKITEIQLKEIIDEVEDILETQLGMDIFDYSLTGKAIDLIYIPESKLESRIKTLIDKIQVKETKIKKLQNFIQQKLKTINFRGRQIKESNKILNTQINNYNEYVQNVNKMKFFSKQEYLNTQKYVKTLKYKLDLETHEFQKEKSNFNKITNTHNNNLLFYTSKVNEFRRLNKQLESISRNFKKVKGVAIGVKELTFKTFYKNGKKIKKGRVKTSMKKIEIYGFENKDELRAVLAHEIGHLVGIPHIQIKNALMNPILQKNQKNKLFLTPADISNFIEHFE